MLHETVKHRAEQAETKKHQPPRNFTDKLAWFSDEAAWVSKPAIKEVSK